MSELDDLIRRKELLHDAEIQILRKIAEDCKEQYAWVFDKPIQAVENPLYDHVIYRTYRDENEDIIKLVLTRNGKQMEFVKI